MSNGWICVISKIVRNTKEENILAFDCIANNVVFASYDKCLEAIEQYKIEDLRNKDDTRWHYSPPLLVSVREK